ncbi:MAG: hypothetical protein KDE28_06915 [Anaerolineales bacterium]|nr:hypothetical protein [Anaerolineales bacterium]MCB8959807.1 hypothetical protein [Ardenticatenales bacterium]
MRAKERRDEIIGSAMAIGGGTGFSVGLLFDQSGLLLLSVLVGIALGALIGRAIARRAGGDDVDY